MKKDVIFLLISVFMVINVVIIMAAVTDVNNDGVTDRTDISDLVPYYRGVYNATFDVNSDGVVDLFDIVIIAKNVTLSNVSCSITSASWDTTETIEGTSVNLDIVTSNCGDGTTISFEVWEDDLSSGDDPVVTEPSDRTISENSATGTWEAEWQEDKEFFLPSNPPEYYFIATIVSSGENMKSSNLLTITPLPSGPVCGNNIIESGEQCDDGNTVSGDGCSGTCQVEGGGFNEPSGFISIYDEPWDDFDKYNYWTRDGQNGSVVANGNLVWTYPAGFGAGYTPGSRVIWMNTPSHGPYQYHRDEGVTLSANWEGHTSGVNKFRFWTKPDTTINGVLIFYGSGTGPLRPGINNQGFSGVTEKWEWDDYEDKYNGNTNFANPTAAEATITRGVPHTIESLIYKGTPGNADGWVKVWLDDVLILHFINKSFTHAGDEARFTNIHFAPIWGGVGGSLSQEQSLSIDRSYVSYGTSVSSPPPPSSPDCGNGIVEGTEQCDDGNVISGDGCSSTCQIESGGSLNPNPDFEENWDYVDTADMKSNPNGWLSFKTYNSAKAETFLDTNLTGTPWGGSKALRTQFFDHPEKEPEAHTDLVFPAGMENPREIWIEFFAKFDSNWTTLTDDGRGGGTDFKWIMFFPKVGGRWGMRVGLFGDESQAGENWAITYGNLAGAAPRLARVEIPATVGPFVGPGVEANRPDLDTWLFNGQWYKYRFHLRMSVNGTSDGVWKAWRDDNLTINVPAFDTGNSVLDYFVKISLGRNLSQGTTNDQAVRFGPIKIWVTDPGW